MRTPKLEPRIHKQIPCSKIKLQLFPMNEDTWRGLEKDGYNPFLELTLSSRKKISSIIRHLNSKWGSSSVAVGQLMLFPYTMKLEQLPSSRRWTSNDSAITAWDVYLAVKTPSLFRLRYGWCPNNHLEMRDIPLKSCPLEDHNIFVRNNKACGIFSEITNQEEKLNDGHETGDDQQEEESVKHSLPSNVKELKASDVAIDHTDDKMETEVGPLQSTIPWDDNLTNLSIGGLLSEISAMGKIRKTDVNSVKESSRQMCNVSSLLSEASLQCKISDPVEKSENKSTLQPILLTASDISIGGLFSEASLLSSKRKLDTQPAEGRHVQQQSPWDDSLTALSIGGLLSEASLQALAGGKLEQQEGKPSVQPNVSLSDSFDAFIAAQLNANSQVVKPLCHESRSSILDAEDTCHGFLFQKLHPSNTATLISNGSSGCNSSTNSTLFRFPKMEMETGLANDISSQELKPIHSLGTIAEDSCLGLSAIKQNESSL